MLTPTGIISNTTWEEVSSRFRRKPLQVRRYWLAQPRSAFLWAEVLLLAAVLPAAWLENAFEVPIVIASCLIFFHVKTLDRKVASSRMARLGLDVAEALSFGFGTAAVAFWLFPAFTAGFIPRLSVGLQDAAAAILLAALLPFVLRPLLRRLIRQHRLGEGILIVGTGDLADQLYGDLAGESTQQRTSGETRGGSGGHSENGVATLDLARLQEVVARERISRVVVAERDAANRKSLADALVDSRLRGLQVNDAVDFYEKLFGKIWVDGLHSEWLVYAEGFRHSRASEFAKRSIDIAFSAMLLLVTAPVMAIVAIAIKLDSDGPVLFRQVRVGLHGKTFVLCKFRSMCDAAEAGVGPVWALEDDPRVTRVGKWLRKFRLDEIPQAINVLRGEMSFVGPRPERPCFVADLAKVIPYYNLRQYVKPGITGWAQVKYGYGASVEDAHQKLEYDIYYAKHRSLRFDLGILIKTVKIVLLGRGR